MSFNKKVAIITGGSRGIGKELCKAFKSKGYWVATCSTSIPKNCNDFDFYKECNVANKLSVEEFFKDLFTKIESIDVLINNAGVAGSNLLNNFNPDGDDLWNVIIDTNLNGTYYFSKHALQKMKRGGRIINISSVLGLMGVPDQTAYCSAKHAVIGLTRSLSKAVIQRGITVNAICPGWTQTDMAEDRMKELGLSLSDLEKSVPSGNIIQPSEVAALALFLCSESAKNITGQPFVIDGGTLA